MPIYIIESHLFLMQLIANVTRPKFVQNEIQNH